MKDVAERSTGQRMSQLEYESVCYRHPDRPAGVRCQRCGRVICRECMQPAAVGFHCPDCTGEARRQAPRVYRAVAPPYLTYALIMANVAVAIAGVLDDSAWFEGKLGPLGVHAGLLGGGLEYPRLTVIGIDAGEWYRVFTGAFLHAGPIHLGFNMFILWRLGAMLEPALGQPRFALLYLVSLLGGSFGALLLEPDVITVGASGAVFGLMGAVFMVERAQGVNPLQSSVGLLILINLFLTFALPGISIGGHVGGLIAGGAMGWLFHEFARRRLSPQAPALLAGGFAVVLFLACLWAASTWADPLFS